MDNQSGFLRLSKSQIINGLVGAIVAAIASPLLQAINAGTFDVFTYEWSSLLKFAINGAFIFLVSDVLTTKKGNFLGAIKRK